MIKQILILCLIATASINSTPNNLFEKCSYTTPQIIQNHPKKTFALGVLLVISGLPLGLDPKKYDSTYTQEAIAWGLVITGVSLIKMGYTNYK